MGQNTIIEKLSLIMWMYIQEPVTSSDEEKHKVINKKKIENKW